MPQLIRVLLRQDYIYYNYVITQSVNDHDDDDNIYLHPWDTGINLRKYFIYKY
jgi:hypothetical protein